MFKMMMIFKLTWQNQCWS